jgi:hypothetical protein
MNRFQRRPQPKQPMTVAQSMTNLTMLLVNCSDHALAAFDPEYLSRCYRVKPAEASKMLTEERGRRAARA